MKIGLVDLDTSHPEGWIPILREMGHEIGGVIDTGDVHPSSYAEGFIKEHSIPTVYSSLDKMANDVDCAILHGCDWSTRIEKARAFVSAGKSILVDKPLAGNKRDLEQLAAWARDGIRITGGSALRFCFEAEEWLAQPVEERGTAQTVFCGCGVDEFNYGIHAYSMLLGILGSGVQSVRHIGQGAQRRLQLNWSDGRCGLLAVGATEAWLPFHASIVTEKTVRQLQPDPSRLYRALLESTIPFLAGEVDEPPLTPEEWIAPELCALAAKQSWQNGDCEVAISAVAEHINYDGPEFASYYRELKYPAPQQS